MQDSKGKPSIHALDDLIKEYLTDGIISEKERAVLLKKAEELGLDKDEMDLYIDAQQQKADQALENAVNKRRGKTCPYCGGSIPALTDKCPYCGANITPEASDELQEIFDKLEDALVNFKSGENIEKNKAEVERYVRKAKMYYGNNPKVQKLLAEVESESAAAEENAKKNARNKAIKNTIVSILTYNKKLTSFFIVLILVFIGWQVYKSNHPSPEKFNSTVIKKLKSGDLDGAIAYYSSSSSKGLDSYEVSASGDAILTTVKQEVNKKLEKGDFDGAELIGSKLLDKGAQNEIHETIKMAKAQKLIDEGDIQGAVQVYLDGENIETQLNGLHDQEYLSFLGSCIKSLVKKGRRNDAIKFIDQQCSIMENADIDTDIRSKVPKIRIILKGYLNN